MNACNTFRGSSTNTEWHIPTMLALDAPTTARNTRY